MTRVQSTVSTWPTNEGIWVLIGTVGLSRTATAADRPSSADRQNIPELRIEKTITLGRPPSSSHDSPFSVADLEKAMTRATLRPRRGTAIAILPEQIVAGA